MSIDEQLTFAIANRRLLQVRYSGRLRVVEPHDYGVLTDAAMLFAYQLRESEGSPRKGVVGWRMFDVARIEACAVLDETFPGSRGESHQRHHTWQTLYARVR